MWAVLQDLAVATPGAVLAVFSALAITVILALLIALRRTKGSERAEIIRALGEFFGAVLWRRR
jgi:hypothetical protein